MKFNTFSSPWMLLVLLNLSSSLPWTNQMSCSYGPRGSLTAICVNATAFYFKITNYRFDYLDETLQCLNCTLRSLEPGTFDIPGNEIKTLDIRNSSITKIWHKAFVGMIYMEKLMLSNNPIEEIYPDAFQGVRKVKYLEMENTVKHLNSYVFQELHLLEVLILSKNELQEIKPQTFEGLHNLRILDLSFNSLRHVNDSFEPLVNLRVLKLSHNSIRRIYGDEFNALKSLISLNLEYNTMFNFTTNLPPENTLRNLNLASNSLDSQSFRPETFANLNNLEELNLDHNEFNNLTVKLFQGLYRLRILILNHNKLTTINTGSFVGLPHLRTLNISYNMIHHLRITGRFALPNLMILDLSNNGIEDFDYMSLILRTPKLRFIDLQNNRPSCDLVRKLEALFENDAINFRITDSLPNCPKLDKQAAAALVEEGVEQIENRLVNNTILIWMFVLITIVISLIGVLFYVQFFIVLRLGPRSDGNMRILNNLGVRRYEHHV